MRGPRHQLLPRPSLPFVLMSVLLVVLWVAGGASRADVLGQSIVRAATWLLLIVAILFQRFPAASVVRPAALIVAAAILLTLLQLVPLPPDLWQALPGRRTLVEAAAASGQPQPWRPWSIVPGATLNAAGSLVVPVAVLVLVSGMGRDERARLVWPLLALMVGSTLIGLLQFSGISLNNPFQNDTPGQVSSTFANRNHFALFLAMGCALIPVWAFPDGRSSGWRAPVAIGLLLLFVLMILATGSRAGLLVGALGLMLGLTMVQHRIRRELRRAPRWAFPAIIGSIVVLIATFVLLSVAANRAASISRIVTMDTGQDMRSRGLPTVLTMIRDYFPAGTGLGGFDPMFRMHEPFGLLKATYFNHAHNDFLEIVLDAGLPGLVVLLGGLGWGLVAGIRAWRAPSNDDRMPQLGATLLLLVLIASVVDYPARTPMIMAIVTLAAVWLNDTGARSSTSALRSDSQHL